MPTLEDLQPFVIEPTPEPVTPPKETKADRAEQNRLFAELLAESAAVERIDELVIDDSLIDDFMKAMQQPEVAKATLRFVARLRRYSLRDNRSDVRRRKAKPSR